MIYCFKLKDPNGTDIDVKIDRGLLRTKVYFNGNALSRSPDKGRPFVIRMSDGKVRRMEIKSIYFFDHAPRVLIDADQVFAVEELPSYQYLWAGLPLLFILLGSPVGGVIGIAAALINLRIFRSELPAAIQVLATLGVTILSGIIWMFFAICWATRGQMVPG